MLLDEMDRAFAYLIDGQSNREAIRNEVNGVKVLRKVSDRDFVFVDQFPLPREFVVEFWFRPLQSKELVLWPCKLVMEISSESFPRAIALTIGRVDRSSKSGLKISQQLRLEKENIFAVSRDLRYLEAFAVALMANTLGLMEMEDGSKSWYERGKATGDFEDTPEDFRILQNNVLKRTRNQKWSDDFLKDVSSLYIQAEILGKRTNLYIAEVIGIRRFEDIPAKTVQKWVAEARRRGFLTTSTRSKNSSPKTSVGSKKPSTTKGKE